MLGRQLWLTILALTVAAPAAAGWLVTTGGQTIETRGDWEVRGSLVVFKGGDGRLTSIRADEIDLDASRTLSSRPQPARAATTGAATPSRSGPALVLTDADVRNVRPSAVEPQLAEEPESGLPEAAAQEPAPSRIEVVDWQDQMDVDHNVLLVTGTIANRGSSLATDTRVEVRLLGETGEILERQAATISVAVLKPEATASFTASFAGSPGFETVDFDVRSRGFRLRTAAETDE